MSGARYYVPLDTEGRTRDGERWPLPQSGQPAEWLNAGDLGRRYLKIYSASDLLALVCLDDLLYRVEVRDIPQGFHEIEKGALGGPAYVVQEARLTARVGSWALHTALHFACNCAEHALDVMRQDWEGDGTPLPQVMEREALDFGRSLARAAQQVADEHGHALDPEQFRDLTLRAWPEGADGYFEQYIGMQRRVAEVCVKESIMHMAYAAKAAMACMNLDYARAANDAALHARKARSALALLRSSRWDDWKEKLGKSLRDAMEVVVREAWEDELAWQEHRLASLLGE
jgi:hypothetical protein